jgi:hypothetical protein
MFSAIIDSINYWINLPSVAVDVVTDPRRTMITVGDFTPQQREKVERIAKETLPPNYAHPPEAKEILTKICILYLIKAPFKGVGDKSKITRAYENHVESACIEALQECYFEKVYINVVAAEIDARVKVNTKEKYKPYERLISAAHQAAYIDGPLKMVSNTKREAFKLLYLKECEILKYWHLLPDTHGEKCPQSVIDRVKKIDSIARKGAEEKAWKATVSNAGDSA